MSGVDKHHNVRFLLTTSIVDMIVSRRNTQNGMKLKQDVPNVSFDIAQRKVADKQTKAAIFCSQGNPTL